MLISLCLCTFVIGLSFLLLFSWFFKNYILMIKPLQQPLLKKSCLTDLSCSWSYCSIVNKSLPLMLQHISYHGYLSRLRNIGENVLCRNNLPACTQPPVMKMPVALDGYTCHWELCSVKVYTVFDFFTHVEQHVRGNPRISEGDIMIMCYWIGKYCQLQLK